MDRRPILAGIAVAVVLVAGVVSAVLVGSGGDDTAAPAPPTTTTTTVAPTTTTAPPTFPLTGRPAGDPGLAARPALVVKIDDTTKALGVQAGLAAADLVYVEGVEGGATRLAAVYHSTDADPVGPVRSARSTDADLTFNLNRPLFVYSGAAQGVLDIIRGANLVDVGYDVQPGLYQTRGSGVLRFFIATPDFFALAPPDSGPPPPMFTFRPDGQAVTAAGAEDSAGVRLGYGGQANTQVAYDVSASGWARSQNGAPHFEESGIRVEPANVVVQFTEYRSSGFVDVVGSPSPEAVTVGEGEAWVLTAGKLVRGRWSRPEAANPTTYTDSAGAPIALTPGTTWIELAPVGSATPL